MNGCCRGLHELAHHLLCLSGCGCALVTINGTTYKVRERIGQGGFSTIDLVEQVRTGKKFALKRIMCHSTEDQIQGRKEIDCHRRLHHPNVLQLVDSDIVGNADIVHNVTSEVLLLMPYFSKGCLHQELVRRQKRNDPLPENMVLKMFLAICDGILHFHQAQPQPLAHRDLKPHNILLADDYTPIIMDLGSTSIARIQVSTHAEAQHLQDVAAERCSITYRPPELFSVTSRCCLDERTDVWSLGCLLYAMCYYQSPYDAVYERGDSVALAVQAGVKSVRFPSLPSFSKGLQDLICSMLTVDIQERPHVADVINQATLLLEANEHRL